jgi:dTDP-glucose 4,6-dehydratase
MSLNDGRVVPNFIRQAIRGEGLTVYGDGAQTRSFQYVDDLVEGVYRLYHSDYSNPVNIGTTFEMTILEFAELVNEIAGSSGGVIFKEQSRIAGDPQTRRPDNSLAKQILGWEPKISVEDGIAKTVAYFREVLK